jgi:hypothetical protein
MKALNEQEFGNFNVMASNMYMPTVPNLQTNTDKPVANQLSQNNFKFIDTLNNNADRNLNVKNLNLNAENSHFNNKNNQSLV